MSFGFRKENEGRKSLGAAELAKRVETVALDENAEDQAAKAGELQGFPSREPVTTAMETPVEPAMGRRRKRGRPQGKILIAGPRSVLDRFIRYTDESGHSAYWNALEELMDAAGASGGNRTARDGA